MTTQPNGKMFKSPNKIKKILIVDIDMLGKIINTNKFLVKSDLKAVICPAAKFQNTSLHIIWEKLNINGAGRFIHCRRLPNH